MYNNDKDKELIKKYENISTENFSKYNNKIVAPISAEKESKPVIDCSEELKTYPILEKFEETIKKSQSFKTMQNTLMKDQKKNIEALEKLKNNMQKFVSCSEVLQKSLSIDLLRVKISVDLTTIADPQETDGYLMMGFVALREKLINILGYRIPNIHISDSSEMPNNTYQICVRGKCVFQKTLSEIIAPKGKCLDIIENLETICLEYVYQIFTKLDTIEYLEFAKEADPTLLNDLVPAFLSAIDLKYILAGLIKKRVSIKDIVYIFEILNFYARYNYNLDELIEIVSAKLAFDK